ncbi:hypothetical protein EV356DRAFT_516840 [Viridothelium virens]|uniref:Uncharacterized protein n=1 Tax=Viridothelium virens TaxID=1048519 RepID=A0A6A6HLQ9_VIRVR|nr:hypothetical protein EV356DRAFT_516840 [Viridothelium virens]
MSVACYVTYKYKKALNEGRWNIPLGPGADVNHSAGKGILPEKPKWKSKLELLSELGVCGGEVTRPEVWATFFAWQPYANSHVGAGTVEVIGSLIAQAFARDTVVGTQNHTTAAPAPRYRVVPRLSLIAFVRQLFTGSESMEGAESDDGSYEQESDAFGHSVGGRGVESVLCSSQGGESFVNLEVDPMSIGSRINIPPFLLRVLEIPSFTT